MKASRTHPVNNNFENHSHHRKQPSNCIATGFVLQGWDELQVAKLVQHGYVTPKDLDWLSFDDLFKIPGFRIELGITLTRAWNAMRRKSPIASILFMF
jgi:hypothetical protein